MPRILLSPRFTLIREDIKRILIGSLVAAVGAALTYLTDMIPKIDLGMYTPVVVAVWSVIANVVRKVLTETSYRNSDR